EQMEERKFARARNDRASGQANEQEWLEGSTSESKQRASLGKRKVNKIEEVIKLKQVGERRYKQAKVNENRQERE
ncbi:9658_t:CDS:1, partial [Ambispora leptoticha]